MKQVIYIESMYADEFTRLLNEHVEKGYGIVAMKMDNKYEAIMQREKKGDKIPDWLKNNITDRIKGCEILSNYLKDKGDFEEAVLASRKALILKSILDLEGYYAGH